jgi:hypothetical protein
VFYQHWQIRVYATDCPHREQNPWTGWCTFIKWAGAIQFWFLSSYKKWILVWRITGSGWQMPGLLPLGCGFGGRRIAWDRAWFWCVNIYSIRATCHCSFQCGRTWIGIWLTGNHVNRLFNRIRIGRLCPPRIAGSARYCFRRAYYYWVASVMSGLQDSLEKIQTLYVACPSYQENLSGKRWLQTASWWGNCQTSISLAVCFGLYNKAK